MLQPAQRSLRMGIIGPGRRVNGIGAYVTKFLHSCGATIVALTAGNFGSACHYAKRLLDDFGINAKPFKNAAEMIARQNLDAVAICSPIDTHLEYANIAFDQGLHVFCDKPLLNPQSENDLNALGQLIQKAKKLNCVLHLNTQWPYTLESFRKLYPKVGSVIRKLSVRLSPLHSDYPIMIADAAPHANSILFALGAWKEFRDSRVEFRNQPRAEVKIVFLAVSDSNATCEIEYEFSQVKSQPRPAGYSINGNAVSREIENSYALYFRGAESRIEIPDPLLLSVKDFLYKVNVLWTSGNLVADRTLVDNHRLLLRFHQEEVHYAAARANS